MDEPQNAYNPYQAPREQMTIADHSAAVDEWRERLRRFQQENRALAGVTIISAIVVFAISTLLLVSPSQSWFSVNSWLIPFASIVGIVVAVLLGVVGFQITHWNMVAVKALLRLSWAGLLAAVLSVRALLPVSILAAIFIGFVIAQAIRVLKWSRQLQESGIPLDLSPLDLTMAHITAQPIPMKDQPLEVPGGAS